MAYTSYDHDKLDPASNMRIERNIYYGENGADISALISLPLERLQAMREESAAAEQTIFTALKEQAAAWEEQAGNTLLLDKAMEYVRTPVVKHTANQWEHPYEHSHEISNMVYKMTYRIYENTRYNKELKQSVPYSWTLSWNIYTNSPDNYRQARIAGQDRKTFADKADMEKYLNGRIKAYQHLFTEISPPIPPQYADHFRVNGQLLPGYTIEGEERKQPEQSVPKEIDEKKEVAVPSDVSTGQTVDPPQPIPVNPIVLTSENSADRLKEITDRLEQGITDLFNSERYKEYLSVMSKFHNYSFNNTLLIAMQKPDASLVAGFSAWKNNFERNVMKGEKGIKIIAPAPFKVKKEVEKIDPQTQQPVIGKDGKPVKETQEVTIPAYKVVSVFDVSQTEGKELPDIAVDTLTGDVEQYKDFFAALEKTSPVPISFEKIEGSANGYYHLEEKRIAIDDGMSELQTLKTAIHEIAHAKLHDIDLNAPKEERQNVPDRRTREVQAESVAYTVCQHYGLDTSDYSFGYVAGWSSGRELAELKSSLETIRAAADEIITSIDAHFAEIQKAKEKEQSAEQDKDTFTIYQIKGGDETQDYRFEPYDRLKSAGLTVDPANYEAVYTAPLTPDMSLEDIYTRFNIDHPKDFTGHSLSVSDVIVLHQNGQDTAHYVDSFGYQQVPEFLQEQKQLAPDELTTGKKITTPRGTFHVTDMTREQMEAAGYGFHYQSNDGKYLIMGNGTQAFAVAVEQAPSMVDNLETKVKAGEQISLVDLAEALKAEKQQGKGKEEKPSIRAQLKADKEKSAPKKAAAKTKNNDLEV